MASPGDVIRRAPFAAYAGLAFVFTWSLLPLAATSIPMSLVALCGPAAAALAVLAFEGSTDREAFRQRVTAWNVPPWWYLVALLLPLPISALRSGLEYVAGARGPITFQPVSTLNLVVFVLVAGEEVGWRGFALPKLLARRGPWRASVLLGIVWAAWHLPLFAMPRMPQFGSPFPAFVVYTIALSTILTMLALRTHGSVVVATVFHGAVNTFGLVNEAADAGLRGWSNAASYGVVALLIGGAAFRRHSIVRKAALAVVFTLGVYGSGAAAQPDQPREAAEAWVRLVDRGEYDESWRAAAAVFKNATTERQWQEAMRAKRNELGVVTRRSVTNTRTLRGTAGTEYLVLDYDTRFQSRPARETITVARETDGRWRVIGYDVR